jgi:hypothetical protein
MLTYQILKEKKLGKFHEEEQYRNINNNMDTYIFELKIQLPVWDPL